MKVVPAAVGIRGDGLLAGFRHAYVTPGPGDARPITFEAAIEAVEYLGDEQFAHLRLGGHALVAKLAVEPRLADNTQASFTVPLSSIALFNAMSGEAIGESALCPPKDCGLTV